MPNTQAAAATRDNELLTKTLNTIFESAEGNGAPEIIFEPQRAREATEVEGWATAPAGSTVLAVLFRMGNDLERQLCFDEDTALALMNLLKPYHRLGWQIDFCHNDAGEGALAYRI